MTACADCPHHEVADHRKHLDAEQDSNQANVQSHVAIKYVTEFVGNHTLKLVAVELLDRASVDADNGIGWRVASGERIDARFVIENVNRRHGNPGRQRHFFDHV